MTDRPRSVGARSLPWAAVACFMLVPLGVIVRAHEHDPECLPPLATDVAPVELPPAPVLEVRVTPSPASLGGDQACAQPRLLVARANFGTTQAMRGRAWAGQLSLGPRVRTNRTFLGVCLPTPDRATIQPSASPFAVADFAPEP